MTHLPPTLLQHVASDDVMSVTQARDVDDLLQTLHTRHALIEYAGQEHHFSGSGTIGGVLALCSLVNTVN